MPERNMADQPVTIEKLINADKDVDSLGEAANEVKVVTPRYGNPYYSGPMAVQHIMDMGGWDSFPTQTELQASTPTTPTKVAIALDTGFLWRFSGGVWVNTNKRPFQEFYDYANGNPLFKAKSLTDTDDLNNILVAGYYTASGGGNTPTLEKNYPVTRPGHLRMDWVSTGSTGTVGFQWYQTDTGEIFWRNTNTTGSAWNPWQQILKTSDLDSTSVMVKNIADGTDINTLTTRGQYYIDNAKANTYLNLPPQMVEQYGSNGGGTLTVVKGRASFITHQYFDGYGEYGSYFRSMNGVEGWNPWYQIGNKVMIYTNKDLNNLLTVGKWVCYTQPADSSNHHFPPVLDQYFVDVAINSNVYRQTAYARATNEIWTRSYWGTNGWKPWVKITTQTELDALKSEVNSALTEVMLGDEIKAELANPFKPTRIKLIGDSITWGMGSSAGSPTEPRSGTLSDVRNTVDTSVSKTWANLLRSWVAKVYGDGTVTADVAGSGWTSCPIYTRWSEIYKTVKMTDKNALVQTDAQKLSYITHTTGLSFNGSSINMVGPNFPSLRPTEMEITLESDHLYFCYSKHAIGDANDLIEVYLDGALHSSFSYYDTVTDINAQFKVEFPMGTHTLRFKNVSPNTNSYAVVWGFRVDKKIYLANDGIIGSSTKTWLDRNLFDGSLSSGKDDLILFMLGTNDRGTVGGQDGYIKRLGECLTKMKALAPHAKIVMMSSTFASNENTTTYKFNMRDANAMMRKFAKANGIKFVSHYEYCAQNLLDGEVIWSDGLHLNDNGNRLYFKNIVREVFNA